MPALTLPPFTPHAGQQRLFAARRKRNVARMGQRWGKTHLLTEVLINRPGGALAGRDGHGRQGLPCAWYAPTDAYFSRVFLEIARQYAATIRRDMLFPLAALNFGIERPERAPRWYLDLGETKDYEVLSKSLPVFVDLGLA